MNEQNDENTEENLERVGLEDRGKTERQRWRDWRKYKGREPK